MLASPANPIVPTSSQDRIANLLTLHVSGARHDSVLLSPGKWSIGSDASNQIVLNDDGVAQRQFLVVVTEHRSLIRNWCGPALWNGNPFSHAVLSDGDIIQVGEIQLSFRLARSLDLISQLPCVADSSDAEGDAGEGRPEGLISELDVSLDSAASEPVAALSWNAMRSSGDRDDGDIENRDAETEGRAAHIDDELLQLEELRTTMPCEDEGLTPRLEVLAQESRSVQSQRNEVESGPMPSIEEAASASDSAAAPRDSSDFPALGRVMRDVAEAEPDSVSECKDRDGSADSVVAEVEDRTVTAEREKLRHYLEEFDAVDDDEHVEREVDEPDEEEDVVAVGAAHLATNYGVSNALRSRDDAVKRLDELVLAATQSSESVEDVSGIGNSEEVVRRLSTGVSVAPGSLLPRDEQPAEDSAASDLGVASMEETDRDNAHEIASAEIEVSVENLGSLLDQVERKELDVEQRLDQPQYDDSPPPASTPSWFDSEFMTEEDVASPEVENGEGPSEITIGSTDGNVSGGDEADSTASSEDSSAAELRQKLAEMFDLPDLPERADSTAHETAAEDSPGPSHNAFSDGTADVADDESSLQVPQSAAAESNAEPLWFSENDTVEDFESETLDHFPSPGVGDRETTDEPDADAVSTFEPERQDADDGDDSINAYMERLLARNRQVTGAPAGGYSASTVESEPAVSGREVSTASVERPESGSSNGAGPSKPESWFEATPRHRQNRDKVRAEVQVLRQIANQSARSAVATASRRDIRKQVIVKTTASLLALTSGVAALLLNVSMLFGLVVLGIGLLFSADLTLTILRNWIQIRNLRKAAAGIKSAPSSDTDTDTDTTSRSSSRDTAES